MANLELIGLLNLIVLATGGPFLPFRLLRESSFLTDPTLYGFNIPLPRDGYQGMRTLYLPQYQWVVRSPPYAGSRSGGWGGNVWRLGNTLMDGTEAILHGIGNTAGFVRDWAGEIARIGVDFASNAALLSVNVGKSVIMPPLRGIEKTVNLLHGVTKLGAGLTQQVIDETKSMVRGGWEYVKSVDFPGKKVMVLLFPTGLISIVDYASHTTWYLWSLTGRIIKATEAWALFASLKVVSSALAPTIRALHLDCIWMREKKMNLNQPMVDTLEMGRSRICGWPNLVPVNNVTITKDENSFLVVRVPYVLENLSTHFDRVNVTGMGDTLIENVRMGVHIDKVHVSSEIAFHSGTVLRFLTIKLRVKEMEGFKITFHDAKGKTYLEESIEAMGDVVSSIVAETVNAKFEKFEDKMSKLIKGD